MVFPTKLACALGIAIAVFAVPGAAVPYPHKLESRAAVPGKWIVTLKTGLDKRDIDEHISWVDTAYKRSLSRRQTAGIERTFGIGSFHAYTGEFDDEVVAEIEAKNEVC